MTSAIAAPNARPTLLLFGAVARIERRVRERIEPFGHADEMRGLLRGDRDRQPVGIGKPDVFRREDHRAAAR